MDIRNFFGGGGKKAPVAKAVVAAAVKEEVSKPLKRRNVIDDDSDDENAFLSVMGAAVVVKETKEEPKALSEATTASSVEISASVVAAPMKIVVKEIVVATVNDEKPVIAEVEDATPEEVEDCEEEEEKEEEEKEEEENLEEVKGVAPKTTTPAKTSTAPTSKKEKKEAAVVVPSVNPDISKIITWKVGESVPYLALVDTFEAVSKVSGRLDKESLFCRLFRAVIATTPLELEVIVHLASNSVGPAYEGLELGIGDSLLVKAVCEATGRNKAMVEEAYEKEGDLGTVALMSRNSQKTLSFVAKPKPLLAKHVLEMLKTITQTKGEKAQSRKVDTIKAIMVKCQGSEAKYIVRALQGKLRIGTAGQTVLVALAHSFALSASPTNAIEEGAAEELDEDDDEDVIDLDKENGDEDDADKMVEEVEDPSKGNSSETSEKSHEKSLLQLIAEAEESEPQEAQKLRKGGRLVDANETVNTVLKSNSSRLTKEARCELAVIAVKRAFSQCPNLSILIKALLTEPLHLLYKSCRLIPGVPVAPMLAKPTKEVKEVLTRLSGQAFTMEYKYDGERAQVHLLPDGTVKIFSRNSEDNSDKYPDLKEVVRRARCAGLESCVLDAEVVAWDREKKILLSFQVLSTRKRKVEDGDEDNQKVKVVLQLFDILYVNGKSLLQQSLRKRRDILKASFKEDEGFLYFASGGDHVEDGDTAPIEAMIGEACAAMCEGLMVKTLDDNASYEPSRRSLNWLKLKKDYIDGMGVCDSVDLVVIGGYLGRGKRANGYGAYLMACYDTEKDEFQSVCKVGTGFKDEDLTRLTELLKPTILGSNKRPINYNVGDPLTPDHWFEATYVWELQAADLSKSNVHKGGIGKLDDRQRGIGLRFPRFIRERGDKKPEGATNSEQIVDMYISQGNDENNKGGGKDDMGDDDYDI